MTYLEFALTALSGFSLAILVGQQARMTICQDKLAASREDAQRQNENAMRWCNKYASLELSYKQLQRDIYSVVDEHADNYRDDDGNVQ